MQDFLDELKTSDPNDFATVLAGLAKLQNRQYHREPLSKSISDVQRLCPNVSRDMIRVVMNRWREEGKLKVMGRGRDARWARAEKQKR